MRAAELWTRVAASCAAIVLLAGCSVEGSLVVEAPDRMRVDLSLTDLDPGDGLCQNLANQLGDELKTVSTPTETGLDCRVTGVVDPAVINALTPLLLATDEAYLFTLNPFGVSEKRPSAGRDSSARQVAITIEFPGQVLESNGQVQGNRVTFTRDQLIVPGGMRAVALKQPGPPRWAMAGAGGVLIGGLLTGLLLRRRRRRDDGPAAAAERGSPPEAEVEPTIIAVTAPQAPPPPRDDSVWAPPDR